MGYVISKLIVGKSDTWIINYESFHSIKLNESQVKLIMI